MKHVPNDDDPDRNTDQDARLQRSYHASTLPNFQQTSNRSSCRSLQFGQQRHFHSSVMMELLSRLTLMLLAKLKRCPADVFLELLCEGTLIAETKVVSDLRDRSAYNSTTNDGCPRNFAPFPSLP